MQTFTIILFSAFLALSAFGQSSNSVKGIVTDKFGYPIPFCNVSVKGTKTAATTDSCGKFELTTGQADFTIVFNCMFTNDFMTFERRLNQVEIQTGNTIVFQLNKHRKTTNKQCKKADKRLKK